MVARIMSVAQFLAMLCPTCPGLLRQSHHGCSLVMLEGQAHGYHALGWRTPTERSPSERYPACVGPRGWCVEPNPTIREGTRKGFSNVRTPVWVSSVLLVNDLRLQIRYLGVHELFQHVKLNATMASTK